MSDGTTFNFGPYGSTNGNNFLTITTINNELIKSVTIDSAGHRFFVMRWLIGR
jgi:hypothetical protein